MLAVRRMMRPAVSSLLVRHYNVTVVGGATELGQTTCMLLRREPSITKLSIYDTTSETTGIIFDLSHIPTESTVKGFTGSSNLYKAMEDADLVLNTGGIPEMPGLGNQRTYTYNTKYIRAFAREICALRPMPFVGIAVEPIDAIVPMAAEIVRCNGDLDIKKLFGITGVDALRAQAMYARRCGLNAAECMVPVIGGHANRTMVPLLSQAMPQVHLEDSEIRALTTSILDCEDEIIEAKKGSGCVLANAYSILLFTRAILRALDGKLTPIHAFVENNDFGTGFLSGTVYVDSNGAREMQRYTDLSQFECSLLEQSIESLRTSIRKGKELLELD